MTLLNMYKLSASNGTLGSPALNTDVTNGFFKWSICGETHSIKSENTHVDSVATLIVDDSIWEIYESLTDHLCLERRLTTDRFNTTTDLVIEPRTLTVTLIGPEGVISETPFGLQFVEHRPNSIDAKTYLANQNV